MKHSDALARCPIDVPRSEHGHVILFGLLGGKASHVEFVAEQYPELAGLSPSNCADDRSDTDDIEGTVDSISNVLEKNIPTSDEVMDDDETVVTNTIRKGNASDRADYNQIRSNDFQNNLVGLCKKLILISEHRKHYQ